MSAVDRKTYLDLLETLEWICTRGEGVAAVRHEQDTMALTMFGRKAVSDLRSLLFGAKHDFATDRDGAASKADRKSPVVDEASRTAPSQILNYLLRQVQIRRIRMTAIKCDRYRVKQLSVLPAELYDIEFRITPGHRIANVGLWSLSSNTLIWKSPQFLLRDIIRVWPARKKKNAAVSDAILRHLQAISTPAPSLTKADALRRCLVEVPDAYPEAFNKAWAILDSSRKRGRGGSRPRGAVSHRTCE